jgi:hypothetical protein
MGNAFKPKKPIKPINSTNDLLVKRFNSALEEELTNSPSKSLYITYHYDKLKIHTKWKNNK